MKRWVTSALASAVIGGAVAQYVRTHPLKDWDRSSFSGTNVNLSEGLVASAALLAGAACSGKPEAYGFAIAASSGAVAGYVDDHMEDRFPAKGKGLKGHLGALKEGKLTSGALKIGLIGAGSALGAAFLPRTGRLPVRVVTWAEQTILVASAANLINLLDLRPGRALKACSLAALPLLAGKGLPSQVGASILATSAVCAPQDLNGTTMLGDMGANSLGASLGMACASYGPLPRRMCIATFVGLTLASEKYSFSAIIESHPILNAIDSCGRKGE